MVLFERTGKTVQLTSKGRAYKQEIHAALNAIRKASLNLISSPLSGTLNLAILPTFGSRWLMPRFPLFLKKHPEITVNFVTKLSPFDFYSEDLHAAIHYGEPNWPNSNSTFLMTERVMPVCSPELLQQMQVNSAEDMTQLPLLHLSSREHAWNDWFALHQISPPCNPGMFFEQFSILIQAATANLGVALLPEFLIQSELAYYLITPVDKSNYAPAVALRGWLLEMIQQ